MKKMIFAVLFVPSLAFAGIGSSFSFGQQVAFPDGPGRFTFAATRFNPNYPTLDIIVGDFLLQTQPIGFLHGLAADEILLDVNGFYTIAKRSTGSSMAAIFAMGANLGFFSRDDLDAKNFVMQAMGRFGAQAGDAVTIGVFIVPGIGFISNDNGIGWAFTGLLQVSVGIPEL